MKTRLRNHASFLVIALAVSACGGGGSGSGDLVDGNSPSGTTPPGNSVAPVQPSPTNAALRQEQERSWAYKAVGGLAALEAGATGAGTKVAVVDGGITAREDSDNDLIDFNNSVDSASITIRSGEILADGNGRDDSPHGNLVSSIISSARDGQNLIGIAPEATILSIDTDETCGESCFTGEDLIFALNHATANNADVINLSLGGPAKNDLLFAALTDTTDQDVVIVASAGNDGGVLRFPAGYAGDSRLGGKLLAVGAVGEDLQIAPFSGTPSNMSEASQFLVAPGYIVSATDASGQVVSVSGTSFAAPFVSGAVAAMKSKYPFMQPEAIVDLILTTARDLGAEGTDLIYGRGMLDLAAVSSPQGSLELASLSGESVGFASTSLELGEAFGDALAQAIVLKDVKSIDRYGRAFSTPLQPRVSMNSLKSIWHSRVSVQRSSKIAGGSSLMGGSLQWQAGSAQAQTRFDEYRRDDGGNDGRIQWSSGFEGGGELHAGLNVSSRVSLSGTESSGSETLLTKDGMANPVLNFAGKGSHIGFRQDGFAMALHKGDGASRKGEVVATFSEFELSDSFTLRHSLLLEEGVALGASSSGAFQGFGDKANSQFVGLGFNHSLSNWNIGLDATIGQTHIESSSANFGDWSTVWSSAFVAHAQTDSFAVEGDRLNFALGQPLRVEEGGLRAVLPVDQNADGQLVYADQRLNATPSGRELRFEISYDQPVSDGLHVNPWLMLRHEPGHDKDAADEAIFGINIKANW